LQLQQQYNVPLLYEGACCASIPIIRNLEEYYDNDLLTAVEGIFNGSTNYILTKIFDENLDFDTALKQAQDAGFAESNPSLDVDGYDPKYKLSIILAHAFGTPVNPADIYNYGITRLSPFDIQYAREKGYRIKLVAQCRKAGDKIVAAVFPKFVTPTDKLFNINNEYNGIVIESIFAETQFFSGKGAGAYPTASAVLSDISALTYNYKYEYKKLLQNPTATLSNDFNVEVFVRFADGSGVKPTDFETVKEFYSSGATNFIIGEINYNTLITSGWINKPEVNVIFTATPLLLQENTVEVEEFVEA
jgi:homoserine dehydrogenase